MANGNLILPVAILGGLAYLFSRNRNEPCPEGEARDPATGECYPTQPPPPQCPEGEVWDGQAGMCVPTGINVPPTPSEVLKRGSSGPKVKVLQRRLCAFFRTYGPVNPNQFGSIAWEDFDDGQFGPGTEQAVSEFQGAVAITMDGQAGPVTRGQLSAQLASLGIDPVTAGNTSCLESSQS